MAESHMRDARKIDPTKTPKHHEAKKPHGAKKPDGATKPDGSPLDNDRIEIGPTDLAFAEWAEAGLKAPDLKAMRRFRWSRITDQLQKNDYAAVLLFDPLNIRYATDSTNMQLWNTHNPFRACLVLATGYMILWDYKNAPFLADHNPLVRETRSGASMFYFATGDRSEAAAQTFAAEVADVMKEHLGAHKRLAVDKIMVAGLRALEAQGLIIEEGEAMMEHARGIKGTDEIRAMRCAMHACEKAVLEMENAAKPGMSEDAIWAVLHHANIARGGEWIETRLLASGTRTNPWFQECGPRIVQNNEILAFDTDLIGCYGICCDMSRTWFLGDGTPTPPMKEDYKLALEHITTNMQLIKPGVSFRDLVFNGHQLPPLYQKQKYSCSFHGVGLCDEWPLIAYPDKYVEGAFEGVLEPGMVLCVEALVSREGGDFSIKLEDQVLVTEDGYENLTHYPFDEKFLN